MWKEKTATSPLGRYLGKYKAWILNDEREKKEIEDSSEITQNSFFQAFENYKISQLCTIYKLDAKLNLLC
eukprot:5757409-Ditylum_brightwellii.AAC.1